MSQSKAGFIASGYPTRRPVLRKSSSLANLALATPEKIHLRPRKADITVISSAPRPWNLSPGAGPRASAVQRKEGEKRGIRGQRLWAVTRTTMKAANASRRVCPTPNPHSVHVRASPQRFWHVQPRNISKMLLTKFTTTLMAEKALRRRFWDKP